MRREDILNKTKIAESLREIFTEHELLVLQIKMYNSVSCQPANQYTINNIIFEKLGGEPISSQKNDVE